MLVDQNHDLQGFCTFKVQVTHDGRSASYPDAGELFVPDDQTSTRAISAFTRPFRM